MDEHIKKAQAAWKKKDAATTVKALEQALDEARAAAPLEIRASAVINHNQRDPRENSGILKAADRTPVELQFNAPAARHDGEGP